MLCGGYVSASTEIAGNELLRKGEEELTLCNDSNLLKLYGIIRLVDDFGDILPFELSQESVFGSGTVNSWTAPSESLNSFIISTFHFQNPDYLQSSAEIFLIKVSGQHLSKTGRYGEKFARFLGRSNPSFKDVVIKSPHR